MIMPIDEDDCDEI